MPNGVSCAIFGIRNLVYGNKEKNVFKKGIFTCQTVRTCDAASKSLAFGKLFAEPVAHFFEKSACLARKIVYPLIIGSGVYNTVKSDDKVRTGASQAGGIGLMYAFEQISERLLKNISSALLKTNVAKSHKAARYGIYIAQGLGFVAASLLGYEGGSRGAEKLVDTVRNHKAKKNLSNHMYQQTISNDDKTEKNNVFKDIA